MGAALVLSLGAPGPKCCCSPPPPPLTAPLLQCRQSPPLAPRAFTAGSRFASTDGAPGLAPAVPKATACAEAKTGQPARPLGVQSGIVKHAFEERRGEPPVRTGDQAPREPTLGLLGHSAVVTAPRGSSTHWATAGAPKAPCGKEWWARQGKEPPTKPGWAEPRTMARSECTVNHLGHHAGAHATREAHATRDQRPAHARPTYVVDGRDNAWRSRAPGLTHSETQRGRLWTA